LLDRLTDDHPSQRTENQDRRFLTMQQLRECVMRDLVWLLNTGNLDGVEDLESYPLVAASTVNYGIPHLAGARASQIEARDMERRLKDAIHRFEPRILRDTIQIKLVRDEDSMTRNSVAFDVEGVLWADPVPWHLYLRTEADLEMGTFTIKDSGGGDGR
jgi:type VI secretion system protein ImpF